MFRVLLMAAALARVGEVAALEEAPPLDEVEEQPAAAAADDLFDDPNDTRLMLVPNARPMKQGQGYFSTHELMFPAVGYALTDNLSVSAGMSLLPEAGLEGQILYLSPKLGFELSDKAALAVGGTVAGVPGYGGYGVGAGYVLGTFGTRNASITAGAGFVRSLGYEWEDTIPVVLIGGQVRVSRSVALVSENWIRVRNTNWDEQPFGFAVRFFNDRLSADLGMVLISDAFHNGYPFPWGSVTYRFGKRGR
jgi:hypothetical protein